MVPSSHEIRTYSSSLDTVDLCLSLHANGRSSCTWVINEIHHTSQISHGIGEPYAAFIHALEQLIEGQPHVIFQWYNGPGAEQFSLRKEDDWLRVEQQYVSDANHPLPTRYTIEPRETLRFTTTERTFLTIGYLQLKKTALLMKDRQFAEGRYRDFPLREFFDFELRAREYLGF